MDFLYINAIVKETYLDLPVQIPFHEPYKSGLLKHGVNDAWLSAEGINSVITYFTLKEQEKDPMFVLTKAERHTNCASVGRFIQSCGWEWTPGRLTGDLSELLHTCFHSEQSINDYALSGTAIPFPKEKSAPKVQLPPLSYDVKFALLTAVVRRWFRNEPALRIAVPKGVDYNEYVLSAMQRIYECFPIALRAEAGFISYLPAAKDASARIYLGFIPEDMADSDTLYLDGSSLTVIKKYVAGTTRKPLDSVIRQLCTLKGEALTDFILELYQDVEGGGDGVKLAKTAAKDYFATGEALALLELQGGMDGLVSAWKKFYDNPSKYTESMQARIKTHISATINGGLNAFCGSFREAAAGGDVFAVLAGYDVFCVDAPAAGDALWTTALQLLKEQNQTHQKIYGSAQRKRGELTHILTDDKLDSLFVAAIEEQLQIVRGLPMGSREEIAVAMEAVGKVEKNVTDSDRTAVRAQLLTATGLCMNLLSDKDGAIVLGKLKEEFLPLQSDPAKSVPELQALIAKMDTFRTKAAAAGNIKGLSDFLEEVDRLRAAKEQALNASDARFNKIMSDLTIAGSYFAMVENLGQQESFPELEAELQMEIWNKINASKPGDTAAYEKAFQSHYGQPLTLLAVSKLAYSHSPFVVVQILEDLCSYGKLTIPYEGASAAVMADLLDDSEHVAKKISPTYTVEVTFNGKRREPKWFMDLLELKHNGSGKKDRKKAGADRDMLEDLCALIQMGVYGGGDLLPALEMLSRCGLPCEEVFALILQGKFRGCTEQQYKAAYAYLYETFYAGKPDRMNAVAKGVTGRDETASKVFVAFHEEAVANKKKKRNIIIAGVVGTLLVVVGVALFVCFRMGVIGQPEATPTPEPTPTVTIAPTPTPTPVPTPDTDADGDGIADTDTTDGTDADTTDGSDTTDGTDTGTDDGTDVGTDETDTTDTTDSGVQTA